MKEHVPGACAWRCTDVCTLCSGFNEIKQRHKENERQQNARFHRGEQFRRLTVTPSIGFKTPCTLQPRPGIWCWSAFDAAQSSSYQEASISRLLLRHQLLSCQSTSEYSHSNAAQPSTQRLHTRKLALGLGLQKLQAVLGVTQQKIRFLDTLHSHIARCLSMPFMVW